MSSTTGPSVLGLDPDADVRRFFHDLLAEYGYRPITPASAHLTPADVAALQPAAVVLDLGERRDPRGLAELRALRQDPATARLPIIGCTTDPRLELAEAPRQGAPTTALVLKPFDIDAFLHTLRAQIGPR